MIHFVGAGPGAADLITLRGARLLKAADVVVYAGSLVNPELLDMCKTGCEIHDSSAMTLEQIVDVMVHASSAGLECVRLHTGDPALYGAHHEQMDALDARGIPYDVVPGVSSLFGATAALRAELTVPQVSQSLVVTRVEGRTPMPEQEKLRDLASHGCTMALFLSAGLLDRAQKELLAGGYEPSTPAAIVVRATWPDEQLYLCTVGTLYSCALEHRVTKTALVLVGRVLTTHGERSLLYDAAFGHGYRNAVPNHSAGGDAPCA
ncbi:MAG: precorrin-4 C(11)-methyltransferase [Atopobiaceae bacterium]|nr:precorrin-4 C(11)-methyltransferase [Atopobiaceae bacterium]